jgi:hypothetical protein
MVVSPFLLQFFCRCFFFLLFQGITTRRLSARQQKRKIRRKEKTEKARTHTSRRFTNRGKNKNTRKPTTTYATPKMYGKKQGKTYRNSARARAKRITNNNSKKKNGGADVNGGCTSPVYQ